MKQAIGARWGGVNGVASVIARIIEIVLWLGVAWLVVGAVLLYMNRSAIVVDADANRMYADSISVSGSFLDVDVYLGRGRIRWWRWCWWPNSPYWYAWRWSFTKSPMYVCG